MTENKDVKAWANEICQQALTEARGGNLAFANRIGANSSFKMFFDNVVGTGNVKEADFPAYYPQDWHEITRLYEAYLQDEKTVEAVNKVDALESKFEEGFAKLEGMITQLMEAQKPVEPVVEKPAKKGKTKVETEVVEAEGAEADAESEA